MVQVFYNPILLQLHIQIRITYTGGKYVANTTRDPVYMYHADAIGGFGKSYTSYSFTGTDEEKANAIAYYLTLKPEGVAISFQDGSRTHTVVFISTTYITRKTPVNKRNTTIAYRWTWIYQ